MEKEVFKTNDYSKFTKLNGNRRVDEARVLKIISSIEKVGYITSPIIVNEKMEVIDGQGRLEALKRLELPVEYIIQQGIGIEECIAMNIHQVNWKDRDYIESYANRGFESYRFLKELLDKYNLNLMVLATALKQTSRIISTTIRDGKLEITQEQYEKATERLNYAIKYRPYINKLPGSKTKLYQAVILCYDFEDVDNERLFEKITSSIRVLTPWHNIDECFVSIEEVYNRNLRQKVYIYTEYRKLQEKISIGIVERLKKAREEDKLELIENVG